MSEDEQRIAVPIEWCYPDNIVSRYATNMIVQHTEYEFILSFFEVQPPILLGSPEEKQEKALHIESIKAECVARIIVSAERMPNFVRVLQDNLSRSQEKSNPAE